jgi:hypothetical protein
MFAEAIRSLSRAISPRDPLWTWDGTYFGYRQGDSLFTYDGIEGGRFSGVEIYGIDGSYLGEPGSSEDGVRLVTCSYKKSKTSAAFVPALRRPHVRLRDRIGLALYCGYEPFPSPEGLRGLVLEQLSNPRR